MNTFKILISALAITLTGSTFARAQTYSPAAIDSLRFMIEEEKLAGDVYRTFGTLYPTIMPFKNIPRSEDTHVASLVAEANAVGLDVTDLTSLAAGHYQNASLQSLYHSLVAQGSTSSFAALTVGKNIELIDIDDLTAARALVPATSSLYTVYGSLTNASNNHLRAFNNWLAMTPPPPVPEPESYAMLLAGLAVVAGVAKRRKNA